MIWAFAIGFALGALSGGAALLCIAAASNPLHGCKPPYSDPGAGD